MRIHRTGHCDISQQTRDIDPMLCQCWASVVDGGPTLAQHWVDVPCLLGYFNDVFKLKLLNALN